MADRSVLVATFEMRDAKVQTNLLDARSYRLTSGAGNNLKVEEHKMPAQSAGRKILICPSTFLWCPPDERALQKIGWARPRDKRPGM